MSTYCHLQVKATLHPDAAKLLAAFCRDWSFISQLPQAPKEERDRRVYESCQDILSAYCDETSIQNLENGSLELDRAFKLGPDDSLQVFLNDFLKHAVASLDMARYQLEGESPVDIALGAPKATPVEEAPQPTKKASKPKRPADTELKPEDQAWEADAGDDIDADVWRKGLRTFLELIADIQWQRRILIHRERFVFPVKDWFDLNCFYFSDLNLEDGFDHALTRGFLTESETDILAPFDDLMRNYLPENMQAIDARKVLKDPEWLEISKQAETLLDKNFLEDA